jgi:nucleotide sugar dehydrogenase
MGLDARIGAPYLTAGVGWGGSCLGKDLAVLRNTARSVGYEPHLLDEVTGVNQRQRRLVIEKLRRHLGGLAGRRVCLLGLAFKPGTDDLRDAPAVDIARSLLSEGASLSACDPVVAAVPGLPDLEVARDPYEAAEGADAVVLLTEWPEFFDLDLHELRRRMQGDLYLDGRNVLKIGPVLEAGFVYESFGRVQPPIGAIEVIDLTLVDVPTTGDGDGNGFGSGHALEIDGPCTIID